MIVPEEAATARPPGFRVPGDELGYDPAAVPIHNAATVMLLRDGSVDGLEVFMLRRTHAAVFGPGFFVFPGGRLDPSDGSTEAAALCDGITDEWASARLGVDSGGLAHWVAAIRECFEEAGVLLASDSAGIVRFDDPVVAERYNSLRHAIHDGTTTLAELCHTDGLRLLAADLVYFAHWITPPGGPRRFSTRFLVARAPAAQDPLHDNSETIDSMWVRPDDALDRVHHGEWDMMPPTVHALEFLARQPDVHTALAATRMLRSEPPLPVRRRYGEAGQVDEVYPDAADYTALPDVFSP